MSSSLQPPGMDVASSSTASVHGRQKRVLPSRSRRGGPGVGTHDMDVMILETFRRKLENEPLIPIDTPFLLTTNSSKFSGESQKDGEPTISINIVANDRYFDRPEVLKAFRDQEIIQTPEFEAINESSTVGGRFRPRGAEDESAETSDAAYEKRHKKFETFEKRQRLREKEKLKHEHYKLKERIEQLRAMDGSAFMAVPAASFSDPPPQEIVEPDEAAAAQASPYAQPNGVAQHAEGERRRKEMLDNALRLEKRYSYLLPPDRVRKTQDSTFDKNQVDIRDEESDSEKISYAGPSRRESESITFRLPAARSSTSTTPAPSPAAAKPPILKKPKPVAQAKQSASFRSIKSPAQLMPQEQIPSSSSSFIDVEMMSPEPTRSTPQTAPTAPPPIELPLIPHAAPTVSKPARNTNGRGARSKTNGTAVPNATNGVRPVPVEKNDTAVAPERAVQEDGESEKALSEDGDTHLPESDPAPEPASDPVDDAPEPAQDETDIDMQGPDEVLAEVREISTRMVQSGDGDEPQLPIDVVDEGPSAVESTSAVEVAPAEESISTRPAKRQRKMTAKARAQSLAQSEARTASVPPPPTESVSARRGRKIGQVGRLGPRGTHSQTYISSTTGEEIRTSSALMMAAIRREGAKRSFEKRHNTSFGIVTPAFKDNYDFEIPEWLHYPDPDESRLPIAAPEPDPNELDIVHSPDGPATGDEAEESAEGAESEEDVDVDGSENANESEEDAVSTDAEALEPEESSNDGNAETGDADSDATESMQIEEPEPVQDALATATTDPEPTERADDTDDDEDLPPVEPEPEPGVTIRVLSTPRDDDEDEQLEW